MPSGFESPYAWATTFAHASSTARVMLCARRSSSPSAVPILPITPLRAAGASDEHPAGRDSEGPRGHPTPASRAVAVGLGLAAPG
jgi:hypothetical protein